MAPEEPEESEDEEEQVVADKEEDVARSDMYLDTVCPNPRQRQDELIPLNRCLVAILISTLNVCALNRSATSTFMAASCVASTSKDVVEGAGPIVMQ